MARYSAAFQVASPSQNSGAPLFELQTAAADSARIVDLNVIATGLPNSGLTLGIGTPATAGVIMPMQFTAPANNGAETRATTVAIGTAWSTKPTAPTKFFRRLSTSIGSATSTQGAFLNFPLTANGLWIAPSSSFVLWIVTFAGTNYANFTTFDFHMEFDA